MAENTVSTNGKGGKGRKVLATEIVYAQSLPQVFRHCGPADALEDAKAIAHFLSVTVETFSEVSAEGCRGLSLVFDLLIDKLDIGSGSYKFPGYGWGDDLPALAEREE